MIYSFDILDLVSTATIVDALFAELPLKTDSLLSDKEGYEIVKDLDSLLRPRLRGFIRFKNKLDAEAMRDKIKSKITPLVANMIEDGAVLRLHNCDHDLPEKERKRCEVVYQFAKRNGVFVREI